MITQEEKVMPARMREWARGQAVTARLMGEGMAHCRAKSRPSTPEMARQMEQGLMVLASHRNASRERLRAFLRKRRGK